LFPLHASKPGAARDLRRAQADRRPVEPAVNFPVAGITICRLG
jgi:hypothetical protein